MINMDHLPRSVTTEILSYLSFADLLKSASSSRELHEAAQPLLNPAAFPISRLAERVRHTTFARELRALRIQIAEDTTLPEIEGAFFTEHIDASLLRVKRSHRKACVAQFFCGITFCLGLLGFVFAGVAALTGSKKTGMIAAEVSGGLMLIACCCTALYCVQNHQLRHRLTIEEMQHDPL